jgi:RP/EB family microtubule-associated protein
VQRIKFNAKHEYEYLDNFKILQKSFKQHKIDKVGPQDFPSSNGVMYGTDVVANSGREARQVSYWF